MTSEQRQFLKARTARIKLDNEREKLRLELLKKLAKSKDGQVLMRIAAACG